MIQSLRSHGALGILVIRAAATFILLNLVLRVVGALATANFNSQAGMVILMVALGMVDLRRRGEFALWANLGYGRWLFPTIYGVVGLAGVILLEAVTAVSQ